MTRIKHQAAITLVLGMLIVLMTAAIVLPHVIQWCTIQSIPSWPACQGTVVSSENNTSLLYEYKVNGKQYQCNREFFDEAASGSETPRYRTGQTVRVHYDPADPGNAVLQLGSVREQEYPRGVGRAALLERIAASLLAMFVGGMGLVLVWSALAKPAHPR